MKKIQIVRKAQKLNAILLLSMLLVNCSSFESKDTPTSESLESNMVTIDTDPVYDIRFYPEQEYSYDDGIYLLENLAVDSSGRIYFADGRDIGGAMVIQIFDRDGTLIGELGREGRGPGEFQSIRQIKISGNRLYAYDAVLRRFTIFSLKTLEPVHTILMAPDRWNHIEEIRTASLYHRDFFVSSDTTLLVGFRDPLYTSNPGEERFLRYYLMDWEGTILSEKIFEQVDVGFPEGVVSGPPPPPGLPPMYFSFTRSSLEEVSTDGSIYSAWTEEFLIRIHSPDGEYEGSLHHPYQNSPLDEEDREKLQNDIGRYVQQGEVEIPDTWPALDQLLVDDENRLWVSTITDSNEHYQWWVLNTNGRLLARFNWPGNRHNRDVRRSHMIMRIKNGYLYAFEAGEEILRDDRIVRYRIEMEEREK